jgi:hypothetical protein
MHFNRPAEPDYAEETPLGELLDGGNVEDMADSEE